MKKFLGTIADYIRETDKILLIICVMTGIYGTLLVLTATVSQNGTRQFFVQAGAFALGLISAVIISRFDYENIGNMWILLAVPVLGLVGLTFIIGYRPASSDNQAWILLPGGMSLQPSELLKILFILTFSKHAMYLGDRVTKFVPMLTLCLHGAIPVGLVILQGDDGTAIIMAAIFAAMMFAAGIKLRYFGAVAGAVAIISPLVWFRLLGDYQRERFFAVYSPTEEMKQGILFQQWRAALGISSGGMTGKGLFNGPMVQSGAVPKHYNDFIFFTAAEELGFLGSIAILIFLLALCLRFLYIGGKSRDSMGKIICVGVFMMFATQSVLNIGMNLSLLPVIGITLPFFSAGGTSVVCNFLGIGLVLSVYINRNKRALLYV